MPFSYSVVIPAYNRATLIGTCLEPLLGPGARGLDVVVVDDGSTDGTADVVRALAARSEGAGIRLVQQANGGAGAARNRGVQEARSDWIVFYDSDDIWMPWAPEAIEQAIAAADGCSLVFWKMLGFDDPNALTAVKPEDLVLDRSTSFLDFYRRKPIAVYGSCNLAVRRTQFLEAGGFDSRIRSAEDQDLCLRLAHRGGVITVVDPVLMGGRTGSPDSLSRNFAALADGLIAILEKRAQGAYVGPGDLLDHQNASMARVAHWRMLDAGDRASARRLLQAASGVQARAFGLRYTAAAWASLLLPRRPPGRRAAG
jgi:glycosyltransferase involved in cell wall biosynthesis